MLKLKLFNFKKTTSIEICVSSISGDPINDRIIVFIKPHLIESDMLLSELQEVGCRFMTWFGSDTMRMVVPMSIIDEITDWGKEEIPMYCPH